MEQKVKNKTLSGGIMVLSVITTFFAVVSIFNIDNIQFRIITQASLTLTTLLNGIRSIRYDKQKKMGYSLIGVSIFLFFVMLFTAFVYLNK